MTTTYISTGQMPSTQTTFVVTGQQQTQHSNTTFVITTASRQRYSHDAHTAAVGILLFAYGGMDMAQGLGWNLSTGVATTYQFEFSWFIGAIIGAILAALALTLVPKRVIYILGGLTQLIDAIICVSAPYQYAPMVAARYVGGVGIGLITVAFIIHNSEVTLRTARGKWCGLEQYGLAMGILIQVIMNSQWDTDSYMPMNRAHGIFGIVFSVIATGSVAMSVESPIFYLRNNNEGAAKRCQDQLLGYVTPTGKDNEVFEEAKRYVSEGNSQLISSQLTSSAMPFLKMLFSRCLVAFSFSLPLSWSMLYSTVLWQTTIYSWPMILWSILRFVGALLGIAVVDTLGRKFISLLGLLCMSGLMLAMGGIYADNSYITSNYFMSQVSQVGMAFQFFAGLFVVSTPTYLGEAFPMHVKPFLIGLVVCIEQLIHIIVIVTFGNTTNCFFQYFVGVGIILVGGLIIFSCVMPETRGLTLREAGLRFRRVHDVMAY